MGWMKLISLIFFVRLAKKDTKGFMTPKIAVISTSHLPLLQRGLGGGKKSKKS